MESKAEFIIPWYFTQIANHEAAYNYLKKFNCLEAYYDRAASIYYDPRFNRVCFIIKQRSSGICVDAAGRALDRHTIPKWFRYSSSDYPFIVGDNKHAILVEDAVSACSVYAAGYTGVALMGTNLKSTYLAELKQFDLCTVALDPDAAKKSIKIASALSPYVKTNIRFIKNDLKYFNKKDIMDMIN